MEGLCQLTPRPLWGPSEPQEVLTPNSKLISRNLRFGPGAGGGSIGWGCGQGRLPGGGGAWAVLGLAAAAWEPASHHMGLL